MDGNQTFTIHPFNNVNPSAGDPTSETNRGYMMRYAQWLINSLGVDGLRIDAGRHVPYGVTNDPYNPQNLNIPALIDRAVYRESRRTNLDGSQRQVFSFSEVYTVCVIPALFGTVFAAMPPPSQRVEPFQVLCG